LPPQIISPLPDQPWGIGMTGSFAADFANFVSGDFLEIELRDQVEGGRIIGYGSVRDLHAPSTEITLGKTVAGPSVFWQTYPQFSASAQGKQVWLRLVHKSSDGTQKDAIVQPQIHDTITGLQIALPALISPTTVTGGFTAADRAEAAETKALAAFPLGGFLPGLLEAFGDAVPTPYGSELITPDRTGGGVLTRPGGLFNVNALGIRFQIISKPPGIGIDEGGPPSYEIPLLELGLTRELKAGEVLNEDSHWFSDENGEWVWNFNAPHQVLYWIQPGVTVRFWWMLLQPIAGELVGPAELLHQPS
jgi:hypothetical protein